MEKEIRKIDNQINSVENRTIDGYALLFNTLSLDLGGFKEQIDSNALNGVIERSDVYALLNHDKEKGVLARSKNGVGSLQLTIDEKGLNYRFDAPSTDLGNTVLEHIKRNEIDSSSFAFTVSEDRFDKQLDGTYIRTILSFDKLFDVSPVFSAATPETTVECKRFLEVKELDEKQIEERDTTINIVISDNSTELNEVSEIDLSTTVVVINTETEPDETEPDCTGSTEPDCTGSTTDTEQNSIVDEVIEDVTGDDVDGDNEVEEETRSIEKIDGVEPSENKNNNKINKRKMEFKLINAIDSIANKRSLTDEQVEFINAGRSEMRKSGQSVNGDIFIPMTEQRDAITAGGVGFGIENVGETKSSLTMALQPNLVLNQAGAKFIGGLVNDFSLPSYTSTSSLWAGETAAATDGAGTFAEQMMKPKRLTTFVDVSLAFLAQDSNGANDQLIASLQESINQKLEKTILGNMTGTTNNPAGLFSGVVPTISGVTYSSITALESQIEDMNVTDYSFIVANKAKSILKSTQKNLASFVYDGKEIDGYPTFNSGNVYGKGIIVADFKNLWIGQWGSVSLTIDNLTQMTNGKVRIIINAFYDAAWVRPSYVVAQLA